MFACYASSFDQSQPFQSHTAVGILGKLSTYSIPRAIINFHKINRSILEGSRSKCADAVRVVKSAKGWNK